MDSGWKYAIASAASLKRSGRGPGVLAPLLDRTGKPISVRTARGSLFTSARRILAGQPLLMASKTMPFVVMISLPDLVWILEHRPETLAEGLAESGFRSAKRRRTRG